MDHIDDSGVIWWAVTQLLFQNVREDGSLWIAVEWEVPPAGFVARDWRGEDRGSYLGGDRLLPHYPHASWRPVRSFKPPLSAAVLRSIPTWTRD